MRMFHERITSLVMLVAISCGVGSCAGTPQSQLDRAVVSAPPTAATAATDATAIAAQSIIDSALQESATPAPPSTDMTPSPTASVAPTSTTAPSPTIIPSPTATSDAAATEKALADAVATALAATQTAQPTATSNLAATSTAQGHAMQTAIATTLTAQPTATPDFAATSTAQVRAIETAIAATLTARPTSTPNLAATRSAQTVALQTAIAATLTAQPRPTATATATRTATPTPQRSRDLVIGASVNGRSIEVAEIGSGDRRIIFVGGLHAGSAPGTAALAQQAADYFRSHPEAVPGNVTLGIVLNANPDARRAPGKLEGRLNATGVDLNRNWDCQWQGEAKWRDQTVSGGVAPFSEPETQALLNYITGGGAVAVIFWEAKMETGQVSAGGCGDRSLVSQPLAEIYGGATGYTVDPWAWYPVNGDAANSLDKRGIPATSVLLRDYADTDWSLNLRGILAVLEAYGR
ncbi:MAG: hypothetical protein IAE81_21590 [Caldilineaceae bacterium]|nr:hypothetical protein [Caldilineaceae bacterium]